MNALEMQQTIDEKIFRTDGERYAVDQVVDLRLYQSGDPRLIFFVHGGGWVAGSIETHDYLARYLCNKTRFDLLSVGYTNSPQSQFPEPLEQCYAALEWATKGREEIILVGDSAGGNMVAALCLLARDRGGPKIAAQVMINPTFDLQKERFADYYLAEPSDALHPYASPLLAEDLSGLPPALIIVGTEDERYRAGVNYAERLEQCELLAQEGVGHLGGKAARVNATAMPALEKVVSFLSTHQQNREEARQPSKGRPASQ